MTTYKINEQNMIPETMKSGFQTSLEINLKNGCDNIWILDEPLEYWSKSLNTLIIVPPGFHTDLASVPRVPIFYLMWGSRAHREAVLHDYLYRKNSIPVVSRGKGDLCLLEAMKSTGKPCYIRLPMYLGVFLGGRPSYHKKLVGDIL